MDKSPPSIDPMLARQLISKETSSKRITKEAALASAELLRLFILNAVHRAGIEAECEREANDNDDEDGDQKAMIRADHIAKIAAAPNQNK